jgi:hypothetical protein
MGFHNLGLLSSGESVLVSANYGIPAPDGHPARSAEHSHLLPLNVELVVDDLDVDVATRRHLERIADGNLISVRDDSVGPSAELGEAVEELERATNTLYKSVLMDAPTIEFRIDLGRLEPRSAWVSNRKHPNDHGIELRELSTAQRRWAEWAINTAIHNAVQDPQTSTAVLTIVDEPEMALHRAAEARMASAISRFASVSGNALLVASHSPEVLNSPGARIVQVRDSELSLLDPADQDRMEGLGLLPSDLLRRQRAFLLVEGQHDLLVLEALLRDELHRLRVEVLPLRGVRQLSAIQSRFLFTFTEAHLIVMLDNLNTQAVAAAWAQTKERFTLDGVASAQGVLEEAFRGRDIEERSLREFLGACIEDNQIGRVTPHGLTHGDIIEYLPVEAFVRKTTTWPQLRVEHEQAKEQSTKFRDFKSWLRKAHGADFSDEAIIAAANRLDAIPPDFVRLLKTIEAVTTEDVWPP